MPVNYEEEQGMTILGKCLCFLEERFSFPVFFQGRNVKDKAVRK
jgi:hypothetical protein